MACCPHLCHVQRFHGHHVLPQVCPDSQYPNAGYHSPSGTEESQRDPPTLVGQTKIKYVKLKEVSLEANKRLE